MQLTCNGYQLDVATDVAMTFVRENGLLDIDNLSLERSTSFKLPKTETNNKAFDLDGWASKFGERMRRKLDAQMHIGNIAVDGWLYIDKVDTSYNCCFLFGDNVGLAKLNAVGDIKHYLKDDYTTTIANKESTSRTTAWATNKYNHAADETILRPRWRVQSIIDKVTSVAGIPSIALPSEASYWQVLIKNLAPLSLRTMYWNRQRRDWATSSASWKLICYYDIIPSASMLAMYCSTNDSCYVGYEEYNSVGGLVAVYGGYVRQYVAKQDIVISFPSVGDDWIIGGFETGIMNIEKSSFDKTLMGGDTYLIAGKKYEIPKGTAFTIIRDSDWVNTATFHGWRNINSAEPMSVTIKMRGADEVKSGDVLSLYDNMPEGLTLSDLLKAIALASGTFLRCNGESITFVDYSDLYASSASYNVSDVATKWQGVERKMLDFGKTNIVKFDDVIALTYIVDNDNIATHNTIGDIPFSRGGNSGHDIVYGSDIATYGCLCLSDISATLASGTWLTTFEVAANPLLTSLCASATAITITCLFGAREYRALKENDIIIFDGVGYLWQSIQWSDGIATFKLQKI